MEVTDGTVWSSSLHDYVASSLFSFVSAIADKVQRREWQVACDYVGAPDVLEALAEVRNQAEWLKSAGSHSPSLLSCLASSPSYTTDVTSYSQCLFLGKWCRENEAADGCEQTRAVTPFGCPLARLLADERQPHVLKWRIC